MRLQPRRALAALGIALFAAQAASAQDFTFTGTFTQDDNVLYRDFTVGQFFLTRFYTTSAATGGFDPILSLFTLDGVFLGDDDDDDFGLGGFPADARDSYLEIELDPGAYRLAISQYDNFWDPTLSVFSRAGQGNFTGPNGPFVDDTGVKRTGSFAVVGQVPIPEPGTYALMATGLVPLAAFLRRRARS